VKFEIFFITGLTIVENYQFTHNEEVNYTIHQLIHFIKEKEVVIKLLDVYNDCSAIGCVS
jgi:hypothetical protein